jgi:regulator of protease activity HflC (stomatin/prohibitin superfamily)
MSTVGWVILLVVALPAIGFLVFLLMANSWVVIPPGRLGLLLVRGRATDTALPPGPHWVASLRRRQIVEYPSVELVYRAGDDTGVPEAPDGRPRRSTTDLERTGPALPVVLGDRAAATVRYTVRFRIDPDQLKSVHDRFGPDGLWGVARDTADRAIALALTDPEHGIDDVFGQARARLAEHLGSVLAEALQAEGFRLTMFHLADVDLAGTGATIQDTVRARYDADLAAAVADLPVDTVRSYQEADLWRQIARREQGVSVVLPARAADTRDGMRVSPPGSDEGE